MKLRRHLILWGALALSPRPAAAASLESVLDLHAAALGWDRHAAPTSALHMRASIDAFGLTGTLETWTEPPLRIWTRLDLGPLTIENGFDGTDGWIRDRNGAIRSAVGAERTGLVLDAIIQSGVYLRHDPPVPLELSVRDNAADEVALTIAPEGRDGQTLILDTDTWRLRRSEWRGSMGPEQTLYADYRPVDGVWLPHRLTMQIGQAMELVATIQSYEFTPLRGDAQYRRPDRETVDIQLSGSPSQALPMRGMGSHVLLMGTIGSRQGNFLLDSGAGGNVLSDRVARELGLPTAGRVEASGVAGTAEATFVDVEKVDVGDLSLLGQSWMSLDFDTVSAGLGGDLIGVLGYDTFQRLVIEIDYEGRWVRFHDPAAFTPRPDAIQIPIRLDANIPTAAVTVEGVEAWVHVDTGSDNTLDLSGTFVHEARLQDDLPAEGASAVLGVGGVGNTTRVTLGELRLGDFGFEDLPTFVHDAPGGAMASSNVAGVLGAGILSRFHCTFDYSRSTLWLRPNGDYQPPVPSSRAGITVRKRRHELVVTAVRDGSAAQIAGIQVGDRVVGVNNRSINPTELAKLLAALEGEDGRQVKLRVVRDGLSRHRRLLLPAG